MDIDDEGDIHTNKNTHGLIYIIILLSCVIVKYVINKIKTLRTFIHKIV